MSARGTDRERRVVGLLKDQDYWAARVAGSRGPVDVVGLRVGSPAKLIQCKSTLAPFAHFSPRERAQLRFIEELTGGQALLCWWPARQRKPVWLESSEWPKERR